jgi:hypothetical protein
VFGYGYSDRCLPDAARTSNDKAGRGGGEDSVGNLINVLISTDEGGWLWRYHRREKRWCVSGISKIQCLDGSMNALCILVDHQNVSLDALNILPNISLDTLNVYPDVADAIENAKLVINKSVNFKDIDCPIQLVGAVLDLITDGFD